MDITNLIDEARRIHAEKGDDALLEYCKATFGENDGAGVAEDIIELYGNNK